MEKKIIKRKVDSVFTNKDNWDKISLDTYKEIYSEAKIRYDDILSQSESISKKSQVLIAISGGIAGWTSSFIFSYNLPIYLVIFLILLFLFDVGILVYQFMPREIPLKGSSPKVIMEMEDDLVGNGDGCIYSKGQKNKLFYYHQINRYNDNYNKVKAINNNRAPKYKLTLLLTYVLFVSVVVSHFYYKPLVSKSESSSVVSRGPSKYI